MENAKAPIKGGKKRILVIGSGPIVIGQGAEFDYSGTQAVQTLKNYGHEVILINPNPATIMTDPELADRVYFEPLNLESILKVAYREMPDALLPTLGGQTALNLAVQLAKSGHAEKMGIEFLGTSLNTIELAEDRELFRKLLIELGEPWIPGRSANTYDDALEIAKEMNFPVAVRPAFTLGGTGGGIADTEEDFKRIVPQALNLSEIGQVLIEKSLYGFKEVEYEIIRDKYGACIYVCNMENLDPVGIHTGDSIVVAPAQTLSDSMHQRMRQTCFKIVSALKVEGGCNVQFAVDPNSDDYFVIEVNPRVSRSSALASKATGYPIARISTAVALGYGLHELKNEVTGMTSAYFEPSLDYIALKFPRWPFDKFTTADRKLSTQMKATGEVMSLGRTYIEALHKAVRSLELPKYTVWSLYHHLPGTDAEVEAHIKTAEDDRIFWIAEGFRRGFSVAKVQNISKVGTFFLAPIQECVLRIQEIEKAGKVSDEDLIQLKKWGISDERIGQSLKQTAEVIKARRRKLGCETSYRMVDTCAGEFGSSTGYFYSTTSMEQNEATSKPVRKAIILGSGPIRIGQGIEFDYSTVHVVQALKEKGIQAIVINNNPETVSTDFSCSDRLYFEPLHPEDVLAVIENEMKSGEFLGVFVQFGGQTAIQLAQILQKRKIPLLGPTWEAIEKAEDRELFERACSELKIARPSGGKFRTKAEAQTLAERLGFPTIIRPSFVLGGRAMEIVWNKDELDRALDDLLLKADGLDLYMDQFLFGKEAEVDLISDGDRCFIPGILEHIEKAGVHSGDSMAVYPPQELSTNVQKKIIEDSKRLTLALGLVGPVNFQYVVLNDSVTVIEVNPRASRTLPFLSKITNRPLARIAARVLLGDSLKSLGLPDGLQPESDMVAVKAPVFSFQKLKGVETSLSPEMKSTGEVMGMDRSLPRALSKALQASGYKLIPFGRVLMTVSDREKPETIPLVIKLQRMGFRVVATPGTAKYMREHGLRVEEVTKIGVKGAKDNPEALLDLIREEKVGFVLNSMSRDRQVQSDGAKMRRLCVDRGIPCFTSLDTAFAYIDTLYQMGLSTVALGEHLETENVDDFE